MITDDHKQPGVAHGQFPPNGYPMMPMWGQGFPMGQPQSSQLPFRTSFSTNDLTKLNNFYQQQRIPPGLSRQSSGFDSTMPSTASATPRNLSRPASPSNEQAPSAKKRRAGSGNSKYPAHLSMTRMDNNFGPMSMQHNQGPTSAGPMQSGFHFSQPPHHGFGRLNQSQSPSDPYASGPTTPLYGPTGGMTPNSAFGTNTPGDYPFYSAPTSQRNSRAASPVSSTRRPHSHKLPQRQSSGYNDPQYQNPDGQQMNPNALFVALAGKSSLGRSLLRDVPPENRR